MAKTANSENVKKEVEGPDYVGAIQIIRGPFSANRSETSHLGQENSTLMKRIDKQCGVHRGAATTFAAIDNMQADKRTDYLRSLLGLLKHAEYGEFNDLVDRAQLVTPPKKAGKVTPPTAKHPSDDSDLVNAGGAHPAEGEADGRAVERAQDDADAGKSAIEKARGHLRAVPNAL